MEMINGALEDLTESVSPEKKRSAVTTLCHVKNVDIMIVRSLTSVSGVVAVEMEMINGALKDLMESVSPKGSNCTMRKRVPSTMGYLWLRVPGFWRVLLLTPARLWE